MVSTINSLEIPGLSLSQPSYPGSVTMSGFYASKNKVSLSVHMCNNLQYIFRFKLFGFHEMRFFLSTIFNLLFMFFCLYFVTCFTILSE